MPRKLLYLVSEDWYFLSDRLPMARAAKKAGYEVHVATRVVEGGRQIQSEGFILASAGLVPRLDQSTASGDHCQGGAKTVPAGCGRISRIMSPSRRRLLAPSPRLAFRSQN